MRHYLVVANQTLVSEELLEIVRARAISESATFHVVVPATPVTERRVWTHGKAHALARDRLDHALKQFAELGADATGEVGDANPMAAIADVLWTKTFDGVILSTLPPGRSEWLRHDLPTRVARAFGVHVTHVIARKALNPGQPGRSPWAHRKGKAQAS
jgi:hypothetical protein